MGFGSPKAVKQEPAPPPVTTSSADVARAQAQEQRMSERRWGYMDTMNPSPGRKSMLAKKNTLPGPSAPRTPAGKSLLA